MVLFVGGLSLIGIAACIVWAIVSKARGRAAKTPLLCAAACFAAFILMSVLYKAPESAESPSDAPEVTEAAQSPESLVEFLDSQYSALGMENYEVAYENGAFVIRLWEPGLTGIATRMANGGEGIPEDLMAEYESWTDTAVSLSDSAHRLVKESGRNEDVRAYILNEWNHKNVIFCAVNGVVSYDVAHGITW